jgi:hypothetical protein
VTQERTIIDWIMEHTPSGDKGWSGPGSGHLAYNALVGGMCESVFNHTRGFGSRKRSLYRAAAQACLAMPGNDPAKWQAAQLEADRLPTDFKWWHCQDADVHHLVKTLLQRHRDNSTMTLQRNTNNASAIENSTCPRVIKASPDRGPAAGGQSVTLTLAGEKVSKRVDIKFGSHKIKRVRVSDDRTAVVKAPSRKAAGDRSTVAVQLKDWNGTQALTSYTYESPSTA